ncbi:MAG: hypothetical protein ACRDBP_06025 [Luteolibacter sp.]
MSPTSPPLNPSQAVERIREIIVGRHLERLEQRVVRLESTGPQAPAAPPPSTFLEDRIVASEAQFEALKDHIRRQLDSTRQQSELHLSQQREETQRLAAQIQQVAAAKANESQPPAVQQLEQKIGGWLTQWQSAFHQQLNDRDRRLAGELRNEVALLWENTEAQITRIQSRAVDRDSIEERFSRIALAARALAECASPSAVPPATTPH